MNRKGQSFAGVAFIMEDNRVLCNSCYQDDETAVWDDTIPYDSDVRHLNYPVECDACKCTLTGGR